jgi:ABC-type multidrug transport system fused ATPase/permease subunit
MEWLASFFQDVVPVLIVIGISGSGIAVAIIGAIISWIQDRNQRRVRARVEQAEHQAFIEGPEAALQSKIRELAASHEGLLERTQEISKVIEESRTTIAMGRLFNLYSQQIEQYQQQTRARATWSFIFAIISMSAGLGFIFWGGIVMLSGTEPIQLTAGGAISAIGGAISAFIVKTFLDVHRQSITQLNRYFQQPVINDHILMA